MKKETLLFAVVCLIVGVLVGVLVSGKRDKSASFNTGSGVQAPVAPVVNYAQRIRAAKELVEKEPENRRAWVQLGNDYFDSDQYPLAIEAYDKALALDPNDANVLTDQGVMYRKLGWYDKAIANFKQANTVDPAHLQSVYNLWVVYRQDLQDLDGAKKAIERYLEINPNGPKAAELRADLQMMSGVQTPPSLPEGHPPLPTGQPGGQ